MSTMAFTLTLTVPFEQAVSQVTAALKEEGFGILTDVDVRATLDKKLGVEFRPYRILGACNPPLAHRALQADSNVGLLLPCNVVVEEVGQGKVRVAFIDPVMALTIGDLSTNEEIHTVALEARERLARVAQALAASTFVAQGVS